MALHAAKTPDYHQSLPLGRFLPTLCHSKEVQACNLQEMHRVILFCLLHQQLVDSSEQSVQSCPSVGYYGLC